MSDLAEFNPNPVSLVKVNSIDSNLNCTYILEGKVKQHFADWEGHLSLKTFSGGKAFYNVGAGSYAVSDESFLLVNESQPYKITVDAESFLESFIIFFETGFAQEVARRFTEKNSQLLDNPFQSARNKIEFIPKLYSRNFIEKPLQEFRKSIRSMKVDQIWLQEKLHEIMFGILAARRESFREIEYLAAVRATTREELYKRIYRARDFMAASFEQNLNLEQISKVACLSQNHLLRTFKQVFHQTPHQYLTLLRLQEAKKLLNKSESSITTICHSVGFQSHSSFSLLFHNHFGVSPKEYRRQKGDFR